MGQMGGGGGGGGEQQQYHYQALLAAVHHQTLPFPPQHHHLPASASAPPHPHHAHGHGGGGGGDDAHAQTPHNAHGHGHGHAPPQSPPTRGFADWSASTSAFTSLAGHPTAPHPPTAAAAAGSANANASANGNANPVHYSISPCYAFWTHYMLDKNAYPPMYPPPPLPMPPTQEDHKDSGSASSFGVDSFAAAPMAPNISAHMPPIQGPVPVKESKKSEGLPRVVKSELETRNRRAELHCETVGAAPESKQAHESCDIKLNSGEYQVILRKELTKSDVGNVGRIVLPKKDAEANLPTLFQRDPVILQMDDMVLPVTWKFKYRYWPNNKSRMYILDSAGEFLKTHGLQAGDALVIYKNSAPGKFIIRGEKAQQATNP